MATPARSARIDAVRKLSDIADEEDRLPQRPLQWLGLTFAAALVGTATGLVGVAFRLALQWLESSRTSLVAYSHAHASEWFGWLMPAAACALGAGIGSWLTQKLSPQTAGSGIPRVESVLRTHLEPAGLHILPVKFVGGVLSIGSGLALGREGPTVQMGGTIGRLTADVMRRFVPEPWTLIAAGAAAGLAVAFNAPLAAALFVVEELLRRFSVRVFSATLVSCITGTVALRASMGDTPDFATPGLGEIAMGALPEYLLLGLLAGFLGIAFNVLLLRALRWFDLVRNWPAGTKGALVGACAGLWAYFAPYAVGGGDHLAQMSITARFASSTILWLLILRFALTLASYGTGAPGGIFAPLLAIGAIFGNGFAMLRAFGSGSPFDPSAYAIVAMSALFTAVVRSPLTGVVLLIEMTGAWTLVLPMMAASLTAYAVPELLGNPPIYDSLRKRDAEIEKREKNGAK